ncbi:MAG: hypothetical protein Fur0039_19180 [Rhodocyclaceae bacterium]
MSSLRAVLGAFLLAWTSGAGAQERIELSAGVHRIEAEVAADFDTRARGLMYRESMPAQAGMLFVFPETGRHCMWMRNTHLALSVAFLDGGGRILNIEDMEPLTETNHCAAAPARYALEMNQGWFARRGIRAGATLRGLERAPAPK